MIKSSLKLLKKDPRRLVFHRHFGAITEFPDSFQTAALLDIKDQSGGGKYETPFCTGYAGSSSIEPHEGVILDPLYAIQKVNLLEGIQSSFDGAPLDLIMKVGVSWGFLEQQLSPYSLNNQTPEFVVNPLNWDLKFDLSAQKHKQKSFLQIKQSNGLDNFDSVRSAIMLNPKFGVNLGIKWRQSWDYIPSGILPPSSDPNEPFSLHAIDALPTWSQVSGEPMIVLQQSYDKLGHYSNKDGFCFINRSVFNANTDLASIGAFMFSDIPADLLKNLQWTWTAILYDWWVNMDKKIKGKK